MKMGAFLATVLLVMAAAQPPPKVLAAQRTGHFSAVAGSVTVRRAQAATWRPAVVGDPLFYGDQVRSGPDGEATIVFEDDSLLKVHANAQLAVNAIVSPVEKKSAVLLFFGRLWARLGRKALQRRSFEVQTTTAVCGVRGTQFTTAAYADGTTVVQVDSGQVRVDNESDTRTLGADEGARLSLAAPDIRTARGLRPEWRRIEDDAQGNLFADGRKYGSLVAEEIHRRRDHLKTLVARAADLTARHAERLAAAADARQRGDVAAYGQNTAHAGRLQVERLETNRQIAYHGRRLACHFGLFSRYGELARDPVLATRFKGREFILAQLDDIQAIQAEFDVLITEGMKLSMADMEAMMDEMRMKMKDFRQQRESRDPFAELDREPD